jgi:hypothetical protein
MPSVSSPLPGSPRRTRCRRRAAAGTRRGPRCEAAGLSSSPPRPPLPGGPRSHVQNFRSRLSVDPATGGVCWQCAPTQRHGAGAGASGWSWALGPGRSRAAGARAARRRAPGGGRAGGRAGRAVRRVARRRRALDRLFAPLPPQRAAARARSPSLTLSSPRSPPWRRCRTSRPRRRSMQRSSSRVPARCARRAAGACMRAAAPAVRGARVAPRCAAAPAQRLPTPPRARPRTPPPAGGRLLLG